MNDSASLRDVFMWLLGLVAALMGLLFKSHADRLRQLEASKADSTAVTARFNDIVDRLNRQDDNSVERDKKIDRILERLPNGRGGR